MKEKNFGRFVKKHFNCNGDMIKVKYIFIPEIQITGTYQK